MSGDISSTDSVSRDKLIADMKVVISDAEELLKATASQAGEKVAGARARIEDSLRNARHKLEEAEEAVTERARAAARATDQFVHENPWKSVGIAAAAGFFLGLLVNRR